MALRSFPVLAFHGPQAVFAAGVRAVQSIDAMAVVYMVTTLIWLVIALRFVNPTQMVTRAKQQPAH